MDEGEGVKRRSGTQPTLVGVFCGRTLSLILCTAVTIDTNSTLAVKCGLWNI